MRARELGIRVGDLPPGPHDAITDVDGVRVGHSTIVRGEGSLAVGEGPVRTGVTVVCPREGLTRDEPVFAGSHTFNGNGEMTGLEWIRVAGTYDGTLNDINGQHVTAEHTLEALASASNGPVEEGSVGGGTGMICHEFKGGIGTASRRLPEEQGGWTVGALVQANYGRRSLLRVDGAPLGRMLGTEIVPSPYEDEEETQPPGTGSIIVILATDAPLLPTQCDRLARRATIGLGRMGGGLDNGSGDIFFAFATGNRGIPRAGLPTPPVTVPLKMVTNAYTSPLFHAAAEATEEAILNALLAAGDMTGRDSITAHGLTPELLLGALEEARENPG